MSCALIGIIGTEKREDGLRLASTSCFLFPARLYTVLFWVSTQRVGLTVILPESSSSKREKQRGGGDSVVTFRAKHNANSGGQKGAISRHAFWVGANQREWMYILKERIIGAQKRTHNKS